MILLAAVLLLSSCGLSRTVGKKEDRSETSPATSTEFTTFPSVREESTVTEESSSAEETEPEKHMTEITLGEMTVKIDTDIWQTIEDYIARKEAEGTPLDEDTIEEMRSTSAAVFAKKDADCFLYLDKMESPSHFDGFGTRQDYNAFAKALNISADGHESVKQFRSTVAERNGFMYLDSVSDNPIGANSHLCTIMKDSFGYMFVYTPLEKASDKQFIYDIMDSAVFSDTAGSKTTEAE